MKSNLFVVVEWKISFRVNKLTAKSKARFFGRKTSKGNERDEDIRSEVVNRSGLHVDDGSLKDVIAVVKVWRLIS